MINTMTKLFMIITSQSYKIIIYYKIMSIQKKIINRNRSRSPLPIHSKFSHTSQSRYSEEEPILIRKKPLKKIENLENDNLIQRLKSIHETLCTCFDIFDLLYQNFAPQRCIAHNNFITLYCQNENKLLCVNCMYGSIDHRNHKVVPLKNAFEKIVSTNLQLNQRLLQSIQDLKKLQKISLENVFKGEQGVKGILDQLDGQYQRIKNIIDQKYKTTRNQILENFSEIQTKNDIIIKEIAWMKSTYIEKSASLRSDGSEASQIFKHLTLNILMDNQKLEQNIFKQLNIQQFRNLYLQQFIKIREMLDADKKRGF